MLIENGADLSAHDNNGRTALHWAAAGNNVDALNILINEYRLDVNSAPTVATYTNSFFNDLIHFSTPLHMAAYEGQVDAIKVLLENGANKDAVDEVDKTALHWAATAGKVPALLTLLDAGLEVNARDACGRTPLHCAAEVGTYEVIAELIQHGAKVDVVDLLGYSILHLAIQYNKASIIAPLIRDYNLSLTSLTHEGTSLLGIAKEHGRCLAELTLRSAGAQLTDAEKEKYRNSHPSCLSALTSQSDRQTLLEALARRSLAPWDPNVIDSSNETPLIKATKKDCVSCIKLLLKDPRTNPNIQDGKRKAALHHAAAFDRQWGYGPEICALLMNLQRTNVAIKDSDNKTARDSIPKGLPLPSFNGNLEKIIRVFDLRKMKVQLYLSLKNARCSEQCSKAKCSHATQLPADICLKIARMLTEESLPKPA